MHEVSTKQTFSFILKMIRPFPWPIVVMFLVNAIWAIDLSLRPYLLKIILNRVAENTSQDIFDYLATPISIYLLMTLLLSSSYRVYGYCVEIKMIPVLRTQISQSVFSYLLEHSPRYYQNKFAGSLTNKVNDLSRSIPDILQLLIDRFFSHFLAVAIAIGALWRVHVRFAISMLIWCTLFCVVCLLSSKRLQRLSDRWSELSSLITGKIVDILSNILSVKLFARQLAEKKSLHTSLQELAQAEQKLQWAYFWVWMVYSLSFAIMQGFCLYFLVQARQQGLISVGDFALVLTINTAIVSFFWELGKDFSQFSKYFGRITQALRTTSLPIEIRDEPLAPVLVVTQGAIAFENVQFHYPGAEPLFEDKSVQIAPGQRVGLVGYSGGGKSTFVNLILRLFDVSSGRILIDGQDIRHVTQNSLREAIAMIPQDPSLFHRTLKENIRYGRPDASEEEVFDAAKRAYAHEFILQLPEGYDSLVGERGVKLSGGQRQRIAIARAILKNAPILILDEATSQLDSITERHIQAALLELMRNKTTIIIAHRLSTLLHMDRLLVFDQGKIVEDGSHLSLLAQGGFYKTLWEAQVRGLLPEKKENEIKKHFSDAR